MRQRNSKFFIYSILAYLGCISVLPVLTGCSDNPDSAAAKKVQQATSQALETAVKEKNFEQAREQIVKSLNQSRAKGLAGDSGRLASGSLWLAQGRQSQSDLDLRMLPIRSTTNSFEKLLRQSESLLLEKERITMLLSLGDQEVSELKQLLAGGETAGLTSQLQTAQDALDELLDEKAGVTDKKNKTQSILDDYQSQADGLLRKAELAQGDEKLKLEKDSFAILHDRKAYYIEVQAAENKIAVLDNQIAMAQTKVDGVSRSIQETQARIDEITGSQTRVALNQQKRQIEETLSGNRKQMGTIASDIRVGMDSYEDEAMKICGVFENAVSEFESIGSRDVQFAATLRLAESYHGAALACASSITLGKDVSMRLRDLMETADDAEEFKAFLEPIKQKLPIQTQTDAAQVDKAMGFFDKAIETYEKAFGQAGSLSGSLAASDKQKAQEAKSSVLKSQLLAVDNKMQLAERLQQYEIADAMTAKTDEILEKGQELGVSFTQSETVKLVQAGINYKPSLPVNLEVYADDLKKKLSEWKRLPLAEQEAAVLVNLQTIEQAVGRYGEELANGLEPLKQEMLAAQKRGFNEPVGGSTGGSNDPNGF